MVGKSSEKLGIWVFTLSNSCGAGTGTNHRRRPQRCLPSFPTPVTEAFTPFQGWGGVREGSTDKDHLLKGLRRAFVLESGLTVRGQKSRMPPVSSGDLMEPPLTSPSAPAWCGLQSQFVIILTECGLDHLFKLCMKSQLRA